MEIIDSVDGYYERIDSPFKKALSESVRYASGHKPLSKIVMGATDAIIVKEKNAIPCLGFGAGIEELAHTPNELLRFKA